LVQFDIFFSHIYQHAPEQRKPPHCTKGKTEPQPTNVGTSISGCLAAKSIGLSLASPQQVDELGPDKLINPQLNLAFS